jgi:peptide-methionine (S)-S-oxide reductase
MLGRIKNLLNVAPTNVDPAKFRSTMTPGYLLFTLVLFYGIDLTFGSPDTGKSEIATFAAGCFWGVEHIFLKHYPPSQNKGILKTSVGYTGGNPLVTHPSYRNVCTGATDHAEALKIEFDPAIVSYDQLVGEFLFSIRNDLPDDSNVFMN